MSVVGHKTDLPMQSPHVRCWGDNGSRISVLRLVFRRRMSLARRKLEQRGSRACPNLLALLNRPAARRAIRSSSSRTICEIRMPAQDARSGASATPTRTAPQIRQPAGAIIQQRAIAQEPATPDTTSSGEALNGDFTNTAHQRSTRPTIAFAQSCGKLQWVLSPRPMRTETLFQRPAANQT